MNITTASRQWASRPPDQRFRTLPDLHEAVLKRREASSEPTTAVDQLQFFHRDRQSLYVATDNGGGATLSPTHWSFGQLCRFAGAPAYYLRTLTADLAAECLNQSILRARNQEVKLLLNRAESLLGAVTSTSYGRIWDADVVETVDRILDGCGGRFYNPPSMSGPAGLYASDHDVFMFFIDGGDFIEAGPADVLHRGFFVWNSETGAKTFGVSMFLFRRVCANHIIWGAEDVDSLIVRHTSGGPARFDRDVIPVLQNYVSASTKPIKDKVQKARETRLEAVLSVPGEKPLSDPWIATFAERFGFSSKVVRQAIEAAQADEGQCVSLWDLEQGLTRVARDIEFIDTRVALETRAGKLLETVLN